MSQHGSLGAIEPSRRFRNSSTFLGRGSAGWLRASVGLENVLFRLLVVTLVASLATALAVSWWFRNRRLVARVLIAVIGGLATACVIWAVIVGLFLAALFEPWPFELRQGPDTEFSRTCYAEFLGEPPPIDVTRVYCRKEWGFGGDSISSIRFAYRATSTIDSIVARLQLVAVPASELGRVRYLSGPNGGQRRTDSLALRRFTSAGASNSYGSFETMEAYYQHAAF